MRERIQKRLAARGVGSRRQVEDWIRAGRITVNGKPASPGQPVDERDDIRLDGRRLRLREDAAALQAGLAYHRPPQESVRVRHDAATASSLERLPRSAGRRWIPVSPLAANDGGLELFVTDGALATALARRGQAIPCEYSLRVRGEFTEETAERLFSRAGRDEALQGRVQAIALAGGEGSNRWVTVQCLGLRPRELKPLFERAGFEVSRAMRTRFGPIAMDRALARGRSRALTEDELQALAELTGSAPGPTRRAIGTRKPGR